CGAVYCVYTKRLLCYYVQDLKSRPMADGNGITSWLKFRPGRGDFWRWGGIGVRVSLLMTVALVLVAALVGAFFYWEGKQRLDDEIRGRALYVARELGALAADDIITGNRSALYQKMSPPFTATEDPLTRSSLLYIMVYNHRCELILGNTPAEVFFGGGASFYTVPSAHNPALREGVLNCEPRTVSGPVFHVTPDRVYDLIIPVLMGAERVGYVRVGISGRSYQQKFIDVMKKVGIALFGILLVGIAFSRIIALGITRPVQRLSEAAERLSSQNWDTPLPVTGSDEISRLSHSFNQMALTLKQREASLSRGNRDLFTLHTIGLDLMESLELEALLAKIAARAEDLVRSDTTAVSVVDSSDRILKYLGVFGGKEAVIRDQELPIEAGGIYNWIVSYGTPLLIPDAQADFRLDSDHMRALGIKGIMTVPLWSSNTMTGLLTAINKKGGGSFDKQDLRLFTVFSSLAAAALQNASLYNDLKRNMDELKSAQDQLLHSTKMAVIGELAANIAHEINNPLTSVLGYTSHLLKTLTIPETPKRILGIMEQETLRVRKIIRNLLDFARQKTPQMSPSDISLPLRETVALVQGVAGRAAIAIQEDYPSLPVVVNMNHNEMKQVFINIVNNAIQAMPQGGGLRIRVRNGEDHKVVVEFADTGCGIAAEHLDRIFEPFFSTKDAGDGTGLGLSISYRIVRNHGGKIEVESAAGGGSVFRVLLPAYQIAAMAQGVQN
ncbi:MAG TPA: ATP-binding protein, partial [Nitrospirota bacterium]